VEVLTDAGGKSLRIVRIPADILSFCLSNSSALLQQPTFSLYFVGAERFWKESFWNTEEDMVGYYKNGSLRGTLRYSALKRDGTRAETRFRLSPKRKSPFKSAGA
jgi:hypothetical protein